MQQRHAADRESKDGNKPRAESEQKTNDGGVPPSVPAASRPPAASASWSARIRRSLPDCVQLLMLLFACGCVYYVKSADTKGRFDQPPTTTTTTTPTPPPSPAGAIPQQPVDIEFTRQVNALAAALDREYAHPADHAQSLGELGIDLAFEPFAFQKGLGIRGVMRTERAAGLIAAAVAAAAAADPTHPPRFASTSPLLPLVRRLAVSHRYIATGDPSADDPASSFHHDHRHCAERTKATKRRKQAARATGRRCRQAKYRDLEQVWREAPADVWLLVQEALVDAIQQRVATGTPADPQAYARLREKNLWKSGRLKIEIASSSNSSAKQPPPPPPPAASSSEATG